MFSTALVRDVLWRASTLLGDVDPQFGRHPEQSMVDALNDGQVAITKFVPAASSRIDSIKLRAGTLQSIERILAADCIPGDGSTPADVLGTQLLDVYCNMGVNGVTPGRSIRLTDRGALDRVVPDWNSKTGAAVTAFMFDPRFPRHFIVTPGVVGTQWLRAGFTAQPRKILNTGTTGAELYAKAGSSAATISIADEHVDDLAFYIAARELMKSIEWSDPVKLRDFTQSFLQSLNAKVIALGGNNPALQKLPFAPEPLGRAK